MMEHHEVIVGGKYRNIKNQKIYKVKDIGLHSETYDMLVSYEDENGNVWFRPIGLFCLKFNREG